MTRSGNVVESDSDSGAMADAPSQSDELDDLVDASDKSQENLTMHEAWLTPTSAGGYKIQFKQDVHGRTLIAGFVDDRVREQSRLQVDDVILSIRGDGNIRKGTASGKEMTRTTRRKRKEGRRPPSS